MFLSKVGLIKTDNLNPKINNSQLRKINKSAKNIIKENTVLKSVKSGGTENKSNTNYLKPINKIKVK